MADIHSNLEALESVLAHAGERGGFDRIWCLGDMVGYGPDPSACLARLRGFDLVAVAGNHDYAAAAVVDAADFNGAAYTAIRWTAEQLDKAEKSFLAGLPMVNRQPPFTLVHGTLRDPIVEYLLHPSQAAATLELLTTPYCLVGHSHFPFICRENGGIPMFFPLPEGQRVPLDVERCIVNPGSVGQPRDRDTRRRLCRLRQRRPRGRALPSRVRHTRNSGQDAAGGTAAVSHRTAGPRRLGANGASLI